MTSTLNKRTQPKPTESGKGKWLGLAIAVVVIAVLAFALIYFFGGAEPAEVDLDSTVNAVTATTAASGAEPSAETTTAAPTESALTDVSGDWSVDTTTGTFSFEDATATFAGFRVEEELAQIGAATAVGRTPEVSGAVTIDGTTITSAEIEVDLTAIVSDESRRENAIRDALNTSQNPTATFVLTEPIDFGEVPAEGVTLSAVATGDLTINGVTRTVEIPLEAQVTGESILIVGSTNVIFADYEIETPSAQVVLSVADEGTIELQLWLVRA
ncbi:MAG TPA: YceI family protein [Acidimicrobiia bacterium]|nr:YceI family protein [Acidimicrobiia bacterium]